MSKRSIPAGAVVRGTDKGYDHAAPKPGSERPVDPTHEDKKYPYLRPPVYFSPSHFFAASITGSADPSLSATTSSGTIRLP